LADNLPRSRYILLEGGHLIWEDAPQEYVANIVSWLQGGSDDQEATAVDTFV